MDKSLIGGIIFVPGISPLSEEKYAHWYAAAYVQGEVNPDKQLTVKREGEKPISVPNNFVESHFIMWSPIYFWNSQQHCAFGAPRRHDSCYAQGARKKSVGYP